MDVESPQQYATKGKVVPAVEKKVIQIRSRVKAENEKEKVESEVKVHLTRSREKSSPETKPIDVFPKKKVPLKTETGRRPHASSLQLTG